MLLEGNKIWISADELDNRFRAIKKHTAVSLSNKSRTLGRPSWKSKKWDKDRRVTFIDYDSIPDTTKSKLPAKTELIRLAEAETTEDKLLQLQEACDNLASLHNQYKLVSDYQWFLKRISSKEKSEDLKDAAGWLRLLNAYKTPKQTKLIAFESKSKLREAVVTRIIEIAKQRKAHLYSFKVTNVAVLQRKELEWAKAYDEAFEQYSNEPKIERERRANEAALGTLVHENFGNNNRRVLGKLNANEEDRILLPSGKIDFSEWNARTLVYLYENPDNGNKFDFENIERRYKFECKKEGREPEVSLSAIKDFLTCNEVKKYVEWERNGFASFDKMLPHVYGKEYEYSLSKGGYDGFQVDFYSRIDGAKLMLTVVVVMDYKSGAVTGYDIGFVEDGLMVRNMYRNHLHLMGGRSYIEIESDRFSGNLAEETQSLFKQTCQFITQPAPNDPNRKAANPKARYVERLIQELNRITQNMPGWKGTNITSIDKNRKPNPDYKNHKSATVDGFAQAKKQIIDLISIYNNDTYNRTTSRMEECLNNINPNAITIPVENIALLLNQNTIATVRKARILITVNRKDYEYEFAEYDLHAHKMMKGYKVKVYYDETDMSTVDVFGENDVYIGRLGKLVRIARAKAEQTEEDVKGLGQMVDKRNKFIERITTVNRKVLEFEASQFGVDISNMSLTEAQEVIAGLKSVNYDELFEEALSTPNAVATANYYEDRLIRSQGEAVPVSNKEKKGIEDQRREYIREKGKAFKKGE